MRKWLRSKTFLILAIFVTVIIIMVCLWLRLPIELTYGLTCGSHCDPKAKRTQDLNQARTLWSSQRISSYRMVITFRYKQYGEYMDYSCQEAIQVKNNIIVTNFTPEQICGALASPDMPETIADLFQTIEHGINVVSWNQCDVLMVNVTYNAKLGYPQFIKYTWEATSPQNVGRDYYSKGPFAPPGQQCNILDMFPPDKTDIEITSFSPTIP